MLGKNEAVVLQSERKNKDEIEYRVTGNKTTKTDEIFGLMI